MRIAVNSRLLVSQKMDGIGRFSYESLKRISSDHAEVQFDLIFDRKADPFFEFPENVNIIHLPPAARHPFLWYLWFEVRLKNYVNKGNYDLFVSPEGWIPPKLNCKSLAVIHDLNFVHHPENIIYSHRKYLQHFFPKFAQRASRIATVSEYSKTDISNTYHKNPNEIDVLYNGANSIFKPISTTEQKLIREKYAQGNPYFIFIGTLHPRKNLTHLLKAFDIFKKNDQKHTQLLVVGNRKWWPADLEKTYQSMEHKSAVQFKGRQTDEVLAKLLASAIALTYIPYFEGFGIPILEAFQSETAVITSNCSSMPEVAKDAALFSDPRAVDTIAAQMKKISTNEELRNNLIEKGANRAKDFSWEKTAALLWKSMLKTIA